MRRRTRKTRTQRPSALTPVVVDSDVGIEIVDSSFSLPETLELREESARRVSSGAVVVRRLPEGTPLFLLLRAWGHWDFPKGAVEQGESIFEAALREVAEESCQTRLSFPWGEDFASTSVYNRDKIAHYFIAFSSDPIVRLLPNPVTGRKEHDHFLWATWSDLSRLLPPRLQPIVDWVAEKLSLPQVDLAPFSFRSPPKIANPLRRDSGDSAE